MLSVPSVTTFQSVHSSHTWRSSVAAVVHLPLSKQCLGLIGALDVSVTEIKTGFILGGTGDKLLVCGKVFIQTA